jgi:hypothetical protein
VRVTRHTRAISLIVLRPDRPRQGPKIRQAMSTSGALLMASAQPKDERMFFRALLLWAIAMIGVVPLLVWFVFVQLGLG